MKNIFTIFLVILVVLISPGCSTANNSKTGGDIRVIKRLVSNIHSNEPIYVGIMRSTNNAITEKRNNDTVGVRSEIRIALKKLGYNVTYSENNIFLAVDLTRSMGLPRIGRNSYLHLKYLGVLNLKLIDAKHVDILSEVEYRRPWAALPPNDLEMNMIQMLMSNTPQ